MVLGRVVLILFVTLVQGRVEFILPLKDLFLLVWACCLLGAGMDCFDVFNF